MKICTICKEQKESILFPKSAQPRKDGSYGRRSVCKRCHSKRVQVSRKLRGRSETKEQIRKYNLKKQFGLSIDQYNTMLAEQNNVCCICGLIDRKYRLAVDHCHKTGKIRGLLCSNCNQGIGHLKDNPALLRKAADYVERNA